MKKLPPFFFLFLCLVFSPLVQSAGEDSTKASELLKIVFSNFSRIKTIQSEISFEIQKNDDYFFLKGTYSSAPDDKYRLEFRPMGSWLKIVSNGKKVWFYVENLKKVYIADLNEKTSSASNVFTTATLAGRDAVSKDYDMSFYKKERKGWTEIHVFKAVPKHTSEFVSFVLLWINPQIKVIQKIETYDLHGNISSLIIFDKYRNFSGDIWFPTRMVSQAREGSDVMKNEINFNKVKINQNLEVLQFEFVIPEKTKVEHVDLEKYRGKDLIKDE